MIDIKPPFFNCECPICYENFDTYVELPCKHIFCKKCIVLSLEVHLFLYILRISNTALCVEESFVFP